MHALHKKKEYTRGALKVMGKEEVLILYLAMSLTLPPKLLTLLRQTALRFLD